jgi:hypothetical protein
MPGILPPGHLAATGSKKSVWMIVCNGLWPAKHAKHAKIEEKISKFYVLISRQSTFAGRSLGVGEPLIFQVLGNGRSLPVNLVPMLFSRV